MDSAEVVSGLSRQADELDRRDREVLAFEGQWWKYAGAKEQAIRERSACRRPATTRC